MKLAVLVWGLVATATVSCGSSGSGGTPDSEISTMGTLGKPSTALIASNLIFVNASMNAMDESSGAFGMLIDSGSPVVLIDPSLFGTTPPTTVAEIPTTIDLGLLDATGQPVVVIDDAPVLQVSNVMMDALGFGGVLGGNVMRHFSVQLDYSALLGEGFCLGCTASTARTDVQLPGGTIPFTLKGGGHSEVTLGAIDSPAIDIPPTRIPVTVALEGINHPFIVDTGATEVSLRSTVYGQLVSDGRAQLVDGITIMTVGGASNASLTRARTITVGDVTVTDPPVMTIVSAPGASPDELLDSLSKDVGTQIDGLLGGSFLRNFLVSIDYPNGQLHLQPYLTPPIPDEFRRVGITIGLAAIGPRFLVASVYPGTDAAAQGIMVNDEIVSVDGASLSSFGYLAAADQLLDGTRGTSKLLKFGTTSNPANTNQTLTVQVDDLIPNP